MACMSQPVPDLRRSPWRRPPRALVLYAVRDGDTAPEMPDRDEASADSAQPPGDEIAWEDWYLTEEEDMSESPDHWTIRSVFTDILTVHVKQRRWTKVFPGSNAFFAWRQDQPLVRVSPDAYLLAEKPSRPYPKMWETWRGHAPPRFALEVVSSDRIKEYEVNPEKYAALGAEELVVYDPDDVGHMV